MHFVQTTHKKTILQGGRKEHISIEVNLMVLMLSLGTNIFLPISRVTCRISAIIQQILALRLYSRECGKVLLASFIYHTSLKKRDVERMNDIVRLSSPNKESSNTLRGSCNI
jgi:hypothetical protein